MVGMQEFSKLPKLPVVLTANLLREGDVVYFDGSEWTRALDGAEVAQSEAAARAMEATAMNQATQVVDAAFIAVAMGPNDEPEPTHYREVIRATGPTIAFGGGA